MAKKEDLDTCCWEWGIPEHMEENPSYHHHLCDYGNALREAFYEEKKKEEKALAKGLKKKEKS